MLRQHERYAYLPAVGWCGYQAENPSASTETPEPDAGNMQLDGLPSLEADRSGCLKDHLHRAVGRASCFGKGEVDGTALSESETDHVAHEECQLWARAEDTQRDGSGEEYSGHYRNDQPLPSPWR